LSTQKNIRNSYEKNPIVSPYLGIGLGVVAASTASIFIRFAQQEANSIVIAAYRLSLATLILAPFAIRKGKHELLSLSQRQMIWAIISGLFLALHFGTWISSLAYTNIASSAILVATSPLWVAILSPVFLGEKATWHTGIGLGIALLGCAAVGLADVLQLVPNGISPQMLQDLFGGDKLLGNFLALAGAWAAAGYLMIGRRLRTQLSLTSYVFIVYGVAAIVLVIAAVLFGQPLTGYSIETFGWFLALALIPQIMGHSLFNWALGYLKATFVSIVLLAEPIGSTILAMWILSEFPSWIEVCGGGLILVGIYIASKK
jgi:drug/metabolite transporter (DMT)-like permease